MATALKGPALGTKHSSMTAKLAPEEVASAGIRPAEMFLIFSVAELGSWVTSRREQGRQAKAWL